MNNTQQTEKMKKLAAMCARMGGTMNRTGRWFDVTGDANVTGYGIVYGPRGAVIVSVLR